MEMKSEEVYIRRIYRLFNKRHNHIVIQRDTELGIFLPCNNIIMGITFHTRSNSEKDIDFFIFRFYNNKRINIKWGII